MKSENKLLLVMVVSIFLGYMPWYGFSAVSSRMTEEFVFRLLTGLSAGAIYAPGMSLLSSWFPPHRRGMALGAYTAALTASCAGGYGIAAPLASLFSWRWGITAISLPVFAAPLLLYRIAGTASVIGEFFFGFLKGMPLLLVLLPAAWIGFWSVADSAVYKAGLADLTAPGMRGTALGLQSAAGFLCTVISPVVFGQLVETGNGSGWGTAFLSLALGAIVAPLAVFFLQKGPTGNESGGTAP